MHSTQKKYQIKYRNADDFTVLKTYLSRNPLPRTDNTNLCPFSYDFVQSTLKESTYCDSVTEQKIVSQKCNFFFFPITTYN